MAYLTRQVNGIIHSMSRQQATGDQRKRRERELAEAQSKLENVKAAILDGIRTPTTKAMLEEWEDRVAHLEASLAEPDAPVSRAKVMPSVIEGHLKDLRRVLARDTERARAILRDLLGEITLEPDSEGLVAVLRGNVPGILGLPFDSSGAGRGI